MMELRWTWSRFETLGVDDLYDALALRAQAFVVEQGAYLDPDGLDRHSWHLLARKPGGELIGHLRAVEPGHKYAEPSLGRVAVVAQVRGRGVGARLLEQALLRVDAEWPTFDLRISAQAHLQAFYAKVGFVTVSNVYLEDAIEHVEMLRPAATSTADQSGAGGR